MWTPFLFNAIQQFKSDTPVDQIEKAKSSIDKHGEINSAIFDSLSSDGFYTLPVAFEARFKGKPSAQDATIIMLKSGINVKVKFSVENPSYFQAEYDGMSGFIHTMYFKDIPQQLADDIQSATRVIHRKQAEQRKIREDKEYKRFIEYQILKEKVLISKYGQENLDKIKNHQIWIGMTDEMARESIGSPIEINKTVYSLGTHEQWMYPNRKYLYFQNGVLTSWQEHE